MALLSEKVITDWLNRKGYYALRGEKIKPGELNVISEALVNDSAYSSLQKKETVKEILSYLEELALNINNLYLGINSEKESKKNTLNRLKELFNNYEHIRSLSNLDIIFIHGDVQKNELNFVKSHGIDCVHIKDIISKAVENSTPAVIKYFKRHLLKQTFWICFGDNIGDNTEILLGKSAEDNNYKTLNNSNIKPVQFLKSKAI